MAGLDWGMIPTLAGAEGASTGYTQGLSNYMQMMNQMMYRRSEIERNTAMAQSYNNRYGQGGIAQQGIDEHALATILRSNPGMTYGDAMSQIGGGQGGYGGAQPSPVNGIMSMMGLPEMQVPQAQQPQGGGYTPPWARQSVPQGDPSQGGMPAGTAPPTPGAVQQPTPMASPQQSGGPVSTGATPLGVPAPNAPTMGAVPASNPMMSMLMTAAKYANQPGAQPPAAAMSGAPAQNMWYGQPAQSPLAPVGGQGGFDYGQADAATAQGALATIRQYQSLLQDPQAPASPNDPGYWQYQGMLRQGGGAYKEAIATLNDVQNRHTQGMTAMFGAGKDFAALTKEYNTGQMNGSDYLANANYMRSQGAPIEPALRPVNAGLSPQQMNNLAVAAQKGTLTPAQMKMIPQGYTLAANDQGNPVFVDKNGVEQEVGSGLTQTAQTGLAQKQAQTSHLQELTSQVQQLLPSRVAISDTKAKYLPLLDDSQLQKLGQEIQINKDKIAVEPQMLNSIIENNLASAGLKKVQGQWVAPQAQARIGLENSQAAAAGGNSQVKMSQAEMEALTKKEHASSILSTLTTPQKYPMTGQPIPDTERVKVGPDGKPQGTPADVQSYLGAQGDYQKFNQMAYQQGQRAAHPPPTYQPGTGQVPVGAKVGDTVPNTQRWWCGQFLTDAYRAEGGKRSVTDMKSDMSLRVKPGPNGEPPVGAIAYWPNSDPNQQHFGRVQPDGKILESTQEGAPKGQRVIRNDETVGDISARHGRQPIYFMPPPPRSSNGVDSQRRIASPTGKLSTGLQYSIR